MDIEQYMKDTYYIAESIPDTKAEKIFKIKVSETILKYLLANEVNDSNIGMYFNDYLPLENTKIFPPKRTVFSATSIARSAPEVINTQSIPTLLVFEKT